MAVLVDRRGPHGKDTPSASTAWAKQTGYGVQRTALRKPELAWPSSAGGAGIPTGLLGEKRGLYGTTRKDALLESVPLGVTTWTFPLLAPAGTVVVISEGETAVKTAAVPLKLTLVAPVRLVPRILTAAPTLPEVGCVFTNGPRPTDRLKIVPSLLAPPSAVVP